MKTFILMLIMSIGCARLDKEITGLNSSNLNENQIPDQNEIPNPDDNDSDDNGSNEAEDPYSEITGTTYYVDPTSPSGGDGSLERPWNSLSQVKAKTFSTGDNLLFKAGTTFHVTERLLIDWHGSENNQVVIGAYHGNGIYGRGGSPRPVFDGNKIYPTNNNKALIQYIGPGHITIQDLHVKNSYGHGISVLEVYYADGRYSQKNIIRNCIATDSGRQGILLARSSDSIVEHNLIDGSSQTAVSIPGAPGELRYAGAGLEVTGMDNEQTAQRNIIRHNIVRRANESIGIYKGARYTTVEYNTVYDISGVGIYAANARDGVIRYNLVYGIDPAISTNHMQPSRGRRNLIWIDSEGHVANIIKVTGGWVIHDNYLAGGNNGIWIQNNSNDLGVYQTNNKIYNNRIVDCYRNIWIHQAVEGWEGNEIYNNYSFTFSSDSVHVYNNTSPYGVTWHGNFYNSAVSGNAAQSAKFNQVFLKKTIDWRDLKPGEVTRDDFSFIDE